MGEKGERFVEGVFIHEAADAAAGEFDKFVGLVGDEEGVDVDRAEIVHDDADFCALRIGEEIIDCGGFACAEETGDAEDGDFFGHRVIVSWWWGGV